MRARNVMVGGILVVCGVVALGQGSAGQVGAPGQGGQGRGRGGEGATVILQAAPTDHAVSIPLDTLKGYYGDMDAKKRQTLRMLEGGRYNVNIRRITNAETALVHPNTADVWVVTQGAGMLTTGGKLESGKIVGGETHAIKPGDVEFIPAGVPHGVSGVTGSITWLNIRFDTNY
jgi:mannose-6-phosphate isomerase-like protein (cupin superfamily)